MGKRERRVARDAQIAVKAERGPRVLQRHRQVDLHFEVDDSFERLFGHHATMVEAFVVEAQLSYLQIPRLVTHRLMIAATLVILVIQLSPIVVCNRWRIRYYSNPIVFLKVYHADEQRFGNAFARVLPNDCGVAFVLYFARQYNVLAYEASIICILLHDSRRCRRHRRLIYYFALDNIELNDRHEKQSEKKHLLSGLRVFSFLFFLFPALLFNSILVEEEEEKN